MKLLDKRATVFAVIMAPSIISTFLGAAGAEAAAARGKALAAQQCAGCHAVEPGGKSPNPKAPAFAAIANEPSATAYSIHVFLQTTHATMPNFVLKADDIDDLVAYIVSLKQKP